MSPRMSAPAAVAAAHGTTASMAVKKPQDETGPRTRRETTKMSDASSTVDIKSVVDEEKLSSLRQTLIVNLENFMTSFNAYCLTL